MSRLLAVLLTFTLALSVSAQKREEPNDPVLLLAKALLLNNDEAVLAKHYFDSIPRRQLIEQLEPYLVKTEVGSDAYTATAYVLAYYKVRPELYVRYMLCQYDKWSVGMDSDTGALHALPRAVSYFYQRDKDEYSLHALLEMKLKGKGASELNRERTQVFLQSPKEVLKEASKDPKLQKNLADSLSVTSRAPERWKTVFALLDEAAKEPVLKSTVVAIKHRLAFRG